MAGLPLPPASTAASPSLVGVVVAETAAEAAVAAVGAAVVMGCDAGNAWTGAQFGPVGCTNNANT